MYLRASSSYQAPYSTIAYTNLIPLPGSSLGFLLDHAYQNASCFNAYSQPKVGGFGYETPPQFPFRPQPIDVMLAGTTTEPSADLNNMMRMGTRGTASPRLGRKEQGGLPRVSPLGLKAWTKRPITKAV
jgi:hypothetical protein